MSKLHIFRKFRDDWTKDADGEGTLSPDDRFEVTIGDIDVPIRRGQTYQIRQGSSPNGELYHCLAGASAKGEQAAFQRAATDVADYELDQGVTDATDYQVNITMDAATVTALTGGGYYLYAFKAVQSSQGNGQPVVWFKKDTYSTNTQVAWQVQYQAYTSTSSIIPNGKITASSYDNINLGQTMNVAEGGIGTVVDGGPSTAISILNTTSTQYACGISQKVGTTSNPMCAFPLYGNQEDVIAPIEKVLLMFATTQVNTGTVIEKAYSSGVLVDLTSDNDRGIKFDINTGWDWGGFSWAQEVKPNSALSPLLIESPSSAFRHRSLVTG